MEFKTFIDELEGLLKNELPGPRAHEPMRAVPVGSKRPDFTHKLPPKPGSVMILLYPDESNFVRIPLIKRPDYTGAHSGQVSFPGGKAEEGEDYLQTALRETEEEIGLKSDQLKVIGRLSDFFVMPSNFMVTPVVAYSEQRPVLTPDSFEVVRILEARLVDLLPDDAITTSEILAAKQYQMMAPHFVVDGEIVWGATAMMLNELRVIIKGIQID